ncbi:rho GTPase-activating protein 21-A-like isoform X8 [Macrobrachium nipponense]|uniref:rho GTPase-activating protein 21-A-like isoform X8 n=1 Tax=Macrobrachium nipponense TaxID=159736 RepID=UPI0030C7D4BD
MKDKSFEGECVGVVTGGGGSVKGETSDTNTTSTPVSTDVNGNPPTHPQDLQLQTSRGGPRLLSITRGDHGFGFTLRHFIVYPPELSELLGEHVGEEAASSITSLEPLDTIFVKHVKQGSSAHLAGLKTGDRVVSVNGESVGSCTYQEVVAIIQRSPPTLQLMVVPREEDLLQQVFGDTAHNPESNLDIRIASPSPLPIHAQMRQQHFFPPASLTDSGLLVSPSHYPSSLSPSAWSSQSSLSSHISAMSTGPHPQPVMMGHPQFQRPQQPPIMPAHPQHPGANPTPSAPQRAGGRKHSLNAGGSGNTQPTVASASRKQSLPVAASDRRQAVHTIQSKLSSVPLHVPSTTGNNSPVPTSTNNSSNEPSNTSVFGVYEPILDRALVRGNVRDSRRLERDPDGRIYEVVQTRVVESKMNAGDTKKTPDQVAPGSHVGRKSSVGGEAEAKRVRVQSLSPPRLRVDQAHLRSASVHTRPDGSKLIRDGPVHGSHQSLKSTKAEAITQSGHKLNRARRSCTEPITWISDYYQDNGKTQEVIERIKKNVERKEEFLRRPNQPIWLPASKAPIIHRDYHVSPQKFPKPLWPPPGAQTPPSPGTITKALSFIVTPKQQEHSHLRRVKSEIEHRSSSQGAKVRGGSVPTDMSSEKSAEDIDGIDKENKCSNEEASTNMHRSLVGNSVPKPYPGSGTDSGAAGARYGKPFISTLSRIQENIPIPEMGSSSSLSSQGRQGSRKDDSSQSCTPFGTPTGSQTSLNSPSVRSFPLAWVGDNERIKQLQIVSRRAKQFETNISEKEPSGKSAFHRFELSRLSQRSKIPNVAQRKQEFEKDGDQLPSGFEFEFGTHYTNSPRQRKSAELARCERISYELSPSPPKVFRSLSDGGSVFPVSRHLYSPMPEDVALHSSTMSNASNGPRVSMNRTIPVGGPHIHCEPPKQYRPQSDSDVLERERSNSVCSQVSMSSLWSTQSMDDSGLGRTKTVARQNSYLSALRSPLPVATPSAAAAGTPTGGEVMGVVTSAATPTVSTTSAPTTTTSTSTTTPTNATAMVSRRGKTAYEDEGERLVRRVSYLKATSGERMYSDSELDSDFDDVTADRSDGVELVRVVGGVVATPSTPAGPLCVADLPSPASLHSAVLRQGTLNVKLTIVDGKKAGDRSWKNVWAVVQGRALIFYKDRQHALQTPLGVEEQISLRGAEVEVASDYTKRRNVLRLATPGGSQLLLQAETPPEMLAWLSTLQDNCAIQEGETGSKTPMNNNVSPQSSNKGMRKLASIRTRSPTGQSPSTKTRKPSNIESNSSPKSKTWRGHLVRPFMKKMQGGSPAVTPTTPLPEGATIGVCLEDCPQSPENDFVPLLVALCISVIETRGLQTQGIYRIPGNKAAVTHLTEMLNKGPKAIDYSDPRWSDVNVISSMLKQFFQKLPDPLFTCELYPHFIEASKIEDPSQRMMELKRIVHELPDHHYETLRFLMMHLSLIVSQSEYNKMDVRNLAIVFGPTLVRSGDDNMVTMVTDMSHQCRIVETLISQAAWFFNEEDGEDSGPPITDSSDVHSPSEHLSTHVDHETPSSQSMLLHNINKVGGNLKGDLKKDIVSSIISAANRKVYKVKNKKNLEDKVNDDSKFNSDKEGGFEERDIDKEAELRKNRLLMKQMESMVELPDPKPMSERKISNMSLMSVQSHASGVSSASQNSMVGDRTSGSEHSKSSIAEEEDGRLFCVVKSDGVGASTTSLSSSTSTLTSMPTSQKSSQLAPEPLSLLGDEVAIRSYAGLSASTQERIRRFEMETRAMLHRDLTKHRRETERRDLERKRLEELWQKAKQDMESEDILDQLADNPTEVVRKFSDYSWRMQGISESVGGERGSLASQGSSSSSQAALISAALSHHPLSNTSLTPTTNVSTQVSNTTATYPEPPLIQVVNAPTAGMACETNTDSKHGLIQQQSLRWLDYNTVSPHSTLGSTSSSSSSGYGSLTRSSDHRDVEDVNKASETGQTDLSKSYISQSPPPTSPCRTKKKKSSKCSGIMFGLTSSSSSPSLFPSMVEGAAELTPTRKIGQTVIYPESPRPPPHTSHLSTQSRPAQVTASSSTLTPHPNTPQLGRHKDSVLHHILPSRLYHSPRPLRRGSSAENVTQPVNIPQSPSTFDTQRVVNNGTLKRARANRDQILNGPEMGMARCSSLDSLRDGSQAPPDDGSDLLSAITATFEEKMRSLQESPLGLTTAASVFDDSINSPNHSLEADQPNDQVNRVKTECRLYRDPSLHRRRTNSRNTSATTCTTSATTNNTVTTTNSKVEDVSLSNKYTEEENKLVSEDSKREAKVKRSDSLTKSEKTENNMKEKTEKRARELKRTDTQESLNEKRPKEMKRSDIQEAMGRSRKSETKENSTGPTKRSSEVRNRKHNVKELKEKFEQNTGPQSNSSPMKPSNNNMNNNKVSKSGMRRTGYRGPIKRRHTVGGTKDLAKWAWLQSGEATRNNPRSARLSAWERLQPLVADERLNTDRSLEAWLAHERIRTSSPDLSRPQQLVLPCDVDDKENLHRRLSVQEATLNPLYPVLESHV